MERIEELIELRREALRQAVERQKDRGFTLDEWSNKAGLSRSTVRQYLAGQSKSMSCETYDRLALAAGCTILELLEVERSSPLTVPVSGYLGVGSEVAGFSEIISTEKDQHVDALPRLDFPQCAIVTAGEYCSPRFNHGDVVYYRNVASPPSELFGQECVAQLDDGRIFIRTLLQGRGKDRFSLVSSKLPVITDVGLQWVKPITWVARKAAQTVEQMRPFGQYAALIRRSRTDDVGSQEGRARILENLIRSERCCSTRLLIPKPLGDLEEGVRRNGPGEESIHPGLHASPTEVRNVVVDQGDNWHVVTTKSDESVQLRGLQGFDVVRAGTHEHQVETACLQSVEGFIAV